MKTLNIRFSNLRVIMMTLVAALAVASFAPPANALVPIPEGFLILRDLDSRGDARYEQMQLNIQAINARMQNQIMAAIDEGKPYAQLLKIVEKASKKAEKEARSMAKDFHKMSNRARQAMMTARGGDRYVDDTYELDAEADARAEEILDVLPEAWFEWLSTVLD